MMIRLALILLILLSTDLALAIWKGASKTTTYSHVPAQYHGGSESDLVVMQMTEQKHQNVTAISWIVVFFVSICLLASGIKSITIETGSSNRD
jgi:hypothetical protein